MIKELIDRIRSKAPDFKTVVHAWTLDQIDEIQEPMPMLVLMPGPLKSEPSQQLPIRQVQTTHVVTVIICPWEQLDSLQIQLSQAVLGYQHQSSVPYGELEHLKGEVRQINGDTVQWMDMFAAQRWVAGTTT